MWGWPLQVGVIRWLSHIGLRYLCQLCSRSLALSGTDSQKQLLHGSTGRKTVGTVTRHPIRQKELYMWTSTVCPVPVVTVFKSTTCSSYQYIQ